MVETAPAGTPAKFVPKVLKVLTVPLLKLRPGMTVYVKITDPMEKAAPLKHASPPKDGEKGKEPPTLIKCINLETGEVCQVIAGLILFDLLNDTYPKQSYVGKGFSLNVSEQKASAGGGGKRYNTYNVSEIEVPK